MQRKKQTSVLGGGTLKSPITPIIPITPFSHLPARVGDRGGSGSGRLDTTTTAGLTHPNK